METIITVLAPLLTVIVFARSLRHFALLERINGRMKFALRHPPFRGGKSLPWLTLPVSALVLVGYLIRAVAWLQAHLLLVVLAAVVGVLVGMVWRWREGLIKLIVHATPPDEPALRKAREKWWNDLNND